MSMRPLAALGLAVGLTLAVTGTAIAQTVIRVQSVIPAKADEVTMLNDFAEQVRALTGGSVDIQVLPAGAVPPNPQELLARPSFGQLLQTLGTEYDVILIDTPAGSQFADGQTVAVRTSGALMVAQRNTSRIGLLRSYADMLQQAGASVVGSVLTDR